MQEPSFKSPRHLNGLLSQQRRISSTLTPHFFPLLQLFPLQWGKRVVSVLLHFPATVCTLKRSFPHMRTRSWNNLPWGNSLSPNQEQVISKSHSVCSAITCKTTPVEAGCPYLMNHLLVGKMQSQRPLNRTATPSCLGLKMLLRKVTNRVGDKGQCWQSPIYIRASYFTWSESELMNSKFQDDKETHDFWLGIIKD